jgi:hypothetical protein
MHNVDIMETTKGRYNTPGIKDSPSEALLIPTKNIATSHTTTIPMTYKKAIKYRRWSQKVKLLLNLWSFFTFYLLLISFQLLLTS